MVGFDEVGIDLPALNGLPVGVDGEANGAEVAAEFDLLGPDGGDLGDRDDRHRQHRQDAGRHHQLDEREAALAGRPGKSGLREGARWKGHSQNWGTEARLKSGR